jgi:hypothetical protein
VPIQLLASYAVERITATKLSDFHITMPAGVPAYIRRCAKAEEFSRHNTNRKELKDYFYTPLEWVEEGEISICMQNRWGTVSLTESG